MFQNNLNWQVTKSIFSQQRSSLTYQLCYHQKPQELLPPSCARSHNTLLYPLVWSTLPGSHPGCTCTLNNICWVDSYTAYQHVANIQYDLQTKHSINQDVLKLGLFE